MLVSTRGRYALRVMLELAQHGRDCYTALSSIASEQGISGKYLESIISTLSKGGLVEGVRGKGGRLPTHPSAGGLLRGRDPASGRGLPGPGSLSRLRLRPLCPGRQLPHPSPLGAA